MAHCYLSRCGICLPQSTFFAIIFESQKSPGLVVMGGDSHTEGRGFESQCRILDGHDIFSHWFVVKNCIVCLKKTENKRKRGRDWPIFLNCDEENSLRSLRCKVSSADVLHAWAMPRLGLKVSYNNVIDWYSRSTKLTKTYLQLFFCSSGFETSSFERSLKHLWT